MEITGTKQAFLTLINTKGFAKKYSFNKTSVSAWKSREVSIEKMELILTRCGAAVIQEKIWKINVTPARD